MYNIMKKRGGAIIKAIQKKLAISHPDEYLSDGIKNAIIFEWVIGLFGLFFIILAYALFMPVGNLLIAAFVENGTPIAQLVWTRNMMIWGLVMLGVLCIAWAFMSSYRKTYDTGEIYGYR